MGFYMCFNNLRAQFFLWHQLLSDLNFILVMFPFQGLRAVMIVSPQWSK